MSDEREGRGRPRATDREPVSAAPRPSRQRPSTVERERDSYADALRERERALGTLFDTLPGMAYRCRIAPDWPMEVVSPGCLGLTGYPQLSLLEGDGTLYGRCILPEDRERVAKEVRRAVEQGRPFELEYRIRTARGEVRWVAERGTGVEDRSGAVLALEGYIYDVTEQRRAEEALRTSEAQARRLVEQLPIPTAELIWTGDGFQVARLNAAMRQLTARWQPIAEWARVEDLLAPFPEILADLRRCHESQVAVRAEHAFPATPGRPSRCFALHYGPVPPDTVLLHAEDLSEAHQLREQLVHAQRMEAVGRLAGGIAHDFNNTLSVILGSAGLLLATTPPEDPGREDLETIHRSCRRAVDLTRQLLAFSRQQPSEPKVLSLDRELARLEKMIGRLLGEQVELRLALGAAEAYVLLDPGQLEQVLLNLAVNAKDAMPGGGVLSLETSALEVDEALAARRVGLYPGPWIRLAVTDTGHGMDGHTLAQAFDPFFTTKPEGKGTGLGLSTVYGIVQQAGGEIHAESEPGLGATFEIYLPEVDASCESEEELGATLHAAARSATVLVVEDDPSVRSLVRRLLRSAGYDVLEASSPDEALALSGRGQVIDLLLADVVLPGGSGPDLFEALRATHPHLLALFMSGYSAGEIAASGGTLPDAPFLSKPFTAPELLEIVSSLIAQPRGP